MGGSFGTPTARPDGATGGAAAGIGAVCAYIKATSSAHTGSVRITSTKNILRNIWVWDLLELA